MVGEKLKSDLHGMHTQRLSMWGVYPHKQNSACLYERGCKGGGGRGRGGEGDVPIVGQMTVFSFGPVYPGPEAIGCSTPSPWIFFQPLFCVDFHLPKVRAKGILHLS
jgi:hypothetical protein